MTETTLKASETGSSAETNQSVVVAFSMCMSSAQGDAFSNTFDCDAGEFNVAFIWKHSQRIASFSAVENLKCSTGAVLRLG